jgi:hypothetical protein
MIQFWSGFSCSIGQDLYCFYPHANFPEPLAQIPFSISGSSPSGFSYFTHFIWIFMLLSISNPQNFHFSKSSILVQSYHLPVYHSRQLRTIGLRDRVSINWFFGSRKEGNWVSHRESGWWLLRPVVCDRLLSSRLCSSLLRISMWWWLWWLELSTLGSELEVVEDWEEYLLCCCSVLLMSRRDIQWVHSWIRDSFGGISWHCCQCGSFWRQGSECMI